MTLCTYKNDNGTKLMFEIINFCGMFTKTV